MRDKQQVLAIWGEPRRQSAAPLAACIEQGDTKHTHSGMQVCDKQQVLAVWGEPRRQSAAPLAAFNEQGDTKQTHSEMQVRDDRRCLPSGVKLGDRALLPWLRVSSKGTQNRRIQECKCEMTAGEVKRQSKLLPCGFVQ